MLDGFGREASSLRISVTQQCNLECFFCHKEGEAPSSLSPMSRDEIRTLVEIGSKLGVRKVKITGGEPLLRPDITDIVGDISRCLDEVSLVTNGTLLRPIASGLRDAGLKRVNVSLHSLDRESYRRIAGKDQLKAVEEGIDAALENELRPVKLNVVVLRGINDSEVSGMIDFAAEKGTILQLIELQRIDGDEWFESSYLDLSSLEAKLQKEAERVRERAFQRRRKYLLQRGGKRVEVEIVRPMHNTAFCMNCTRLRTTSDGRLKPCLMRNDNLVEFVSLLRGGAGERQLSEAFKEAIRRREPYWKG